MNTSDKKKLILEHDAIQITQETQQLLNTPLKKDDGIAPEDKAFLEMLIAKIDDGTIRIHFPSTLINLPVYDKLTEEDQGKADYQAFLMIAKIREIYNLYKLGHHDSYQILNLVHSLRQNKEYLEKINGDIYII